MRRVTKLSVESVAAMFRSPAHNLLRLSLGDELTSKAGG